MATLKYFLTDFFGSLVKWPVWWYSAGLVLAAKSLSGMVTGYSKQIAVKVWMKNLFVPMFGQNDWQSRIISFTMRVVQIIGRSIFVIVLAMTMFVVFLGYLLLPVVALFGLVFQIFGSLIVQ